MATVNPALLQDYYRLNSRTFPGHLDPSIHRGKYTYTLEEHSKDATCLPLGSRKVTQSLFQSEFSAITSFFQQCVENFCREKVKYSKEATINLQCNLLEWNLKIAKRNEKIENSPFLSTVECILQFVTRGHFSLKFQELDLEAFTRRIWDLDLQARKERESKEVEAKTVSAHPLSRAYTGLLSFMGYDGWQGWWSQHQANYIAHAVNCDQVDAVLESGLLMPSEAILRVKGYVHHEGNFFEDHRQVCSSPLHPEVVLKMARIAKEKFSLDKMVHFRGELPECPDYYLLDQYLARDSFVGLNLRTAVFFALDYLSEESVDQKLCKLYKAKDQQWNGAKRISVDFKTNIIVTRNKLVPTIENKVLPTIRATQNSIAWEYGPVVILKGNPASVISHPVKGGAVPNEVSLLYPFENDGKLFSLDLTRSDDLMILGPQKLLEKHKPKYGNRMHYIEDLNAEQVRQLQVNLEAHKKKN